MCQPPCVEIDSMHRLRASLWACGYGKFNWGSRPSPPQQIDSPIPPENLISSFPPHSKEYRPSKHTPTENIISHCDSTMLSLHFNTIIIFFTITITTLPLLTTSIPTTDPNQTTSTTTHPAALADLPTSILPHELAADTCPTPPTEFLPYAPPPGYTPAPGCPPASQGTQPSEGDAPAGFYGGSESGSGSGSSGSTSSAETSEAGSLRGPSIGVVVGAGRVLLVVLGWWGLKMCVCSGSG